MFVQGDLVRAHALAEECLALEREAGTKFSEADALALLGEVTLHQGNTPTARLLIEKSCTFWREIGNETKIACTLSLVAKVNAVQGDYTTARALYEESLVKPQGMNSNLVMM